jgi:hypothetical protein
MQIIALELSHCNLCCPVTGQPISAPGGYQVSPAQVGLWLGGLLEQPEIRCPKLHAAWESYVAEHAVETGIYLDAFLQSVELPNYVCFAITASGIGSDPYSSTVWYEEIKDTHRLWRTDCIDRHNNYTRLSHNKRTL